MIITIQHRDIPKSLEAHRNKGLHLHFNTEYKMARISFNQVIEIDPTFEEAFFNIGNTFLGEYTQKIRLFH